MRDFYRSYSNKKHCQSRELLGFRKTADISIKILDNPFQSRYQPVVFRSMSTKRSANIDPGERRPTNVDNFCDENAIYRFLSRFKYFSHSKIFIFTPFSKNGNLLGWRMTFYPTKSANVASNIHVQPINRMKFILIVSLYILSIYIRNIFSSFVIQSSFKPSRYRCTRRFRGTQAESQILFIQCIDMRPFVR